MDPLETVVAVGGGWPVSQRLKHLIHGTSRHRRTIPSRLLVGTEKYKDFEQTYLAIEASGTEIFTIAICRTNIG